MNVGDRYAFRVFSRLGDQLGVNVVNAEITGLGGTPSLQEMIDAWSTWASTRWAALMTSAAQYYGSSCQQIMTTSPVEISAVSTAGQGAGASGATPLPALVSGILTLNTGIAGRSFRGRLYMPFPSTADQQIVSGISIPATGYQVNLLALATDLRTTITLAAAGGGSIDLRVGIRSRKLNVFNYVNGVIPRAKWAEQHRRGSYGRPNSPPF
jgi:hypothetical protein